MNDTNDSGFNGTVKCGNNTRVIFRNGYDITQLKEFISFQPYDQFYWIKRERKLLYRNNNGEFFKLIFEKIEL